jgi:hypothetical protein
MSQEPQVVSMMHAARHVKASAEALDYYQQLLQTLSVPGVSPPNNTVQGKKAREALMQWNGYYPLSGSGVDAGSDSVATGAFFAIDANMVVTPALSEPYLDVTLILSLDGKQASRFAFSAEFDGNTLTQLTSNGTKFELSFVRNADTYGPVATCTGTITLPGCVAVNVTGYTYNNPIQAPLFAGKFYASAPASTPVEVLEISANYQLRYDFGTNNGALAPVPAYVYNLNMYYFLFPQQESYVHLIMGTSGNKGFACNDMCDGGANPVRSLLTIPDAPTITPNIFGAPDIDLVNFSGYYPLTYANGPDHCTPAGFVSIQAQYSTLLPGFEADCYMVLISWSFDGVHSQGCYFDHKKMTYKDGELTIPEFGVKLALTRSYDQHTNALVKMEGVIGKTLVAGFTPFNPVPLVAFGGLPLTNASGDCLAIQTANSVIYNDQENLSVIYVPLMYILAYPALFTDVVMSLGTDGTHGTACIVTTNVNSAQQQTTAVWSLPPA